MANPEHLKILKQGVAVWNQWRKEEFLEIPDLSKVDLSGANLMWADLHEVYMSGVVLSKADLRVANLNKANLYEANLSETDLRETNLAETYLNGADLRGAKCGWTIFSDIDLSGANGLESLVHRTASTVSIDTLIISKGKIPEVFLRGCGVPEALITYLPSLIGSAIEFYSCFISYSHADKAFARRVHDTLQARGIRCWLDEHQMVPGQDIFKEVDRGIRLWDKVLLCASKNSLTSWWVDNELETLFEKERGLMRERGDKIGALIPLDLDGYLFSDACTTPKKTQIQSRLAANFQGWDGAGGTTIFDREIERVIKALRTDEGREPPPPTRL